MKRFILVLFGLALVAVCASWFMGLMGGVVDAVMGPAPVETNSEAIAESATRSARRAKRLIGGLDLNTVLNFANAVIGFVGLVVTYKASRGNSDTSSA